MTVFRLVLADRVHGLASGGHAGAPPDALLLQGDRIVALGRAPELRAVAHGADIVDLRGTTLTPGLTDAHIHLLEWALSRRELDLVGCRSPEDVAAAVAGRRPSGVTGLAGTPALHAGGWLRGRGWNPHHWGGAYPHRRLLDAAAPGRPVVLQSHDMHAVWVSSTALAAAGIDSGTADPAGGRIVRDERGEPTGVLLEMAAQLVTRRMPAPGAGEAEGALLEAQGALHRLGITGVHVFPAVHLHQPDSLRLLDGLLQHDRLRLRVLHHLPLDGFEAAVRRGLRSGVGGDWLRIGAVKLFLDGALGSRTAWLREPYEGAGEACGLPALAPAELRELAGRIVAAGFAIAAHAIGDAAVELALDVLADPALRLPALPHRIEHLQLCPPERLGDAARAGIVASVQPAHLITDWSAAERCWGERCRGAFAFASLLRGGAADGRVGPAAARPGGPEGAAQVEGTPETGVLAFGSDAPVEPVDPRLALYAATVRQDTAGRPSDGWFPQERIGIEDALRAYTLGPARAAGLAGRRGLLAPGADADFVAWDRDPLETRGTDLLRLRCLAAAVAGGIVWREGD